MASACPSAGPPAGVREVDQSALQTAVPAPERGALRAAYAAETARILRARLSVAGAIFFVCMAAALGMETAYNPARALPAAAVAALWTAVWLLGLGAVRRAVEPRRTVTIAAAVQVAVAVLMSAYGAAVHGELELFGMGQLCLMCGLAAVLPWGWEPQLAISLVGPASLWLASPFLSGSLRPAYLAVGLATGAVTSMIGAVSLERYRSTAFTRAALLGRASAVQREEAEIATALLAVGHALHVHLGRDDLVAEVSRLAAAALGSDDTYIYLWDERRRVFRLGVASALRPEIRDRLGGIEFDRDWDFVRALRPGYLCEIADATRQALIPPSVMRFADCASLLQVPLCRGDDVIAVLVFSYRRRTGAFTAREHRLAFGVAHAAAVALENARLIAGLQATNRLKSEFLSTMSHELRTPLNVIAGYADILSEQGFGPLTPEQADAVERIRQSTRHQLDLVDATIDLNRLEAGRDVVDVGAVDLDELFLEVRRDLRAADDALVTLSWRNTAGRRVTSDRAKLKTILRHLLGNALKFTAAGEVEVTVGEDAGGLTLAVRDTGIGIAPADLPAIFEMFRQADGSHTRRFDGAGLGLHVVHRLVERLHGTVTVESTPGAGSLFTVHIPAATGAREDAAS